MRQGLWHWVPELDGEPRPHRERQLSPLERHQLRTQKDEWITAGVVELAPQNLPWVNNLVFVAKKNGDTRVCVDCTPTNEVTKDFGWPLPRLQDLRHRLKGANRMSRIDLRNAFFRISIPRKYRHLTAFRSDGFIYWFVKMPFGLKTAPEVFQKMMDHILAKHWNYAYWYIDDILIWGQDSPQLESRTRKIISTLETNGHHINHDKSTYNKVSLLFTGVWITPRGLGPNFEKLRSLLELPAPTNKTDAQSALGLASYLRDFIPLASMLTAKMTGTPLSAESYAEEWHRFKTHIAARITTLAHWDEDLDARLYTDASKIACGAVLIQNEQIIAVASRKFTGTETRYSATDREHLGLILGSRKFRLFLQRNQATTHCFTDHKALLTRRITELTPRQARWRMEIANNIPLLQHVKGKQNPADFFSRLGAIHGWGPNLCLNS
jgi:hypothetical protein